MKPMDTALAPHETPAHMPPPAAVKKPKNGVGMAIFATVIIVLGLATLATYAFLKTRN